MRELAWLIAPFSIETFFAKVWQRQPRRLTQGRASCFAGLFSPASVERILEFSQPQPPSVRFADRAADGPLDVPFSANGRINMDKVRKHYLAGRTVILNMVEDHDPQVAGLARAIETELGARVQVNCYLTPSGAQGFSAHYDTHDVLVVQIEGEKRWKIYGGDAVCPLNEMSDGGPADRKARATPQTLTLKAGDVLYIPRGWIHEAETQDAASLHLTFGIHPPLGKDLLTAALDELCSRRPELREALPPGPLGRADRAGLRARFDALMALFAAEADLDAAVNAVESSLLRRGRSAGDGRLFTDMDRLRSLDLDWRLERRDMACRLVQLEDGFGLQFAGAMVTGTAEFEAAMAYVRDAKTSFRIGDLPGLAPDRQLAFAMSLVTDGLCRIADPCGRAAPDTAPVMISAS